MFGSGILKCSCAEEPLPILLSPGESHSTPFLSYFPLGQLPWMFPHHSCFTPIPMEAGSTLLPQASLFLPGGWTPSSISLLVRQRCGTSVISPGKGTCRVGLICMSVTPGTLKGWKVHPGGLCTLALSAFPSLIRKSTSDNPRLQGLEKS